MLATNVVAAATRRALLVWLCHCALAAHAAQPRHSTQEVLANGHRVVRHCYAVTVHGPQAAYPIEAGAKGQVKNLSLTIRNLDQRVSVVPRLSEKGWPNLASVDGILKSILKEGASDEQKATAIWRFLADWRYNYCPAEVGDEMHDPVKLINVYGYGFCDDSAESFAILCQAAGIKARIHGLSGHVVGEAFYGGRWHMFDPDHQVCYRLPDGQVASVDELAAHPEAITKTSRDPVGSDTAAMAQLYTTTKDNEPYETHFKTGPRLEPNLMPGDEVVFDFAKGQRAHRVSFRDQPLPPTLGNGRLVRQLNLDRRKGEALIHLQWPYVMLGGELRLSLVQPDAPLEAAILDAGNKYAALPATRDAATVAVNLDKWFDAPRAANYACTLRITSADGRPPAELVRNGRLTTVFQFAPRAVPQVKAGRTEFEVHVAACDKAALPADWRGIEIVHRWDEEPSD